MSLSFLVAAALLCYVHACTYSVGLTSYDLSSMDNGVDYQMNITLGRSTFYFAVAPPCRAVLDSSRTKTCGGNTPVLQVKPTCISVANVAEVAATQLKGETGLKVTFSGGDTKPSCAEPRAAIYNLICDKDASETEGPRDLTVDPSHPCQGVITWRHPAACGVKGLRSVAQSKVVLGSGSGSWSGSSGSGSWSGSSGSGSGSKEGEKEEEKPKKQEENCDDPMPSKRSEGCKKPKEEEKPKKQEENCDDPVPSKRSEGCKKPKGEKPKEGGDWQSM